MNSPGFKTENRISITQILVRSALAVLGVGLVLSIASFAKLYESVKNDAEHEPIAFLGERVRALEVGLQRLRCRDSNREPHQSEGKARGLRARGV